MNVRLAAWINGEDGEHIPGARNRVDGEIQE